MNKLLLVRNGKHIRRLVSPDSTTIDQYWQYLAEIRVDLAAILALCSGQARESSATH
jgi:hypothetical protein